MTSPRLDVTDRLEVPIEPGGTVIAISDLHLPPERTTVSGRSCEVLARRLAAAPAPLTVILAGDIVEMLAYPGRSAAEVLDAHDDLCSALAAVTGQGGQVIYTVGNHDGDLAWDLKAATAVREATGAQLCLAADLVFPGGKKVRVEHGHQVDPYNCFHDPRNPLDTPLGHHIVREVIPKLERIGRDWLTGAHEMADPADFPSFLASRLVYRKLVRHLWWVVLLPIAAITLVLPALARIRDHYPDTGRWLHDGEILGYGALVDIAIIALVIAIVSRRAWTSISALALAGRGYSQNSAARERCDALIAEGYAGYLSGHTHHPELHAHGDGFYGNTGSCTSVVEAIDTIYGMPPVYLRTQQLSWLEMTTQAPQTAGHRQGQGQGQGQHQDHAPERARLTLPCHAQLKSARVELPGATRFERFLIRARNPHAQAPRAVARWPEGPDWPSDARHMKHRHLRKAKKILNDAC
ncbi:MAG TPA: metallophosphoesterase [Trebonia sp.]|jgi:UDP-2,3-diacylglucosamine pyrophosphatase LpxH